MKIVLIGTWYYAYSTHRLGCSRNSCMGYKDCIRKIRIHEVLIINTKNGRQIIDEINNFKPDFVHVHYDEFVPIVPFIQYPNAITSHFGYLERRQLFNGYINESNEFTRIKPNVFCLSEGIEKVYNIMFDIDTYVTPNGVNVDEFNFVSDPEFPDRSIYLAKIDYRKRQHLFQSIESLWYAGNIILMIDLIRVKTILVNGQKINYTMS